MNSMYTKENSLEKLQEYLELLSQVSCLTKLGKKDKHSYIKEHKYNVHGTRLFLTLRPVTNYANPNEYSFELIWTLKEKNKKKYKKISFEEILDLDFIGKKAKEELLFHLDLFKRS